MKCKSCLDRGKIWEGSDPKCGFKDGIFTDENWNCATLVKLRTIAEKLGFINNSNEYDKSICYIPVDNCNEIDDLEVINGYIVMMWYKNRGRTGTAIFMTDEKVIPLELKHAELALVKYQ